MQRWYFYPQRQSIYKLSKIGKLSNKKLKDWEIDCCWWVMISFLQGWVQKLHLQPLVGIMTQLQFWLIMQGPASSSANLFHSIKQNCKLIEIETHGLQNWEPPGQIVEVQAKIYETLNNLQLGFFQMCTLRDWIWIHSIWSMPSNSELSMLQRPNL